MHNKNLVVHLIAEWAMYVMLCTSRHDTLPITIGQTCSLHKRANEQTNDRSCTHTNPDKFWYNWIVIVHFMALCWIESVSAIDFRFCYIYRLYTQWIVFIWICSYSFSLPFLCTIYLSNGVNLAQNASSFILIDYSAISGVD